MLAHAVRPALASCLCRACMWSALQACRLEHGPGINALYMHINTGRYQPVKLLAGPAAWKRAAGQPRHVAGARSARHRPGTCSATGSRSLLPCHPLLSLAQPELLRSTHSTHIDADPGSPGQSQGPGCALSHLHTHDHAAPAWRGACRMLQATRTSAPITASWCPWTTKLRAPRGALCCPVLCCAVLCYAGMACTAQPRPWCHVAPCGACSSLGLGLGPGAANGPMADAHVHTAAPAM